MTAEPPDPESLRLIAALCDGEVSFRTDGWRQLVFMEGLRFLASGQPRKMDALLCLNHDNQSYPTKLYLEENVGGSLNWNETAYLLGRSWHTFSWSGVLANQTAYEILALHLAALSPGK